MKPFKNTQFGVQIKTMNMRIIYIYIRKIFATISEYKMPFQHNKYTNITKLVLINLNNDFIMKRTTFYRNKNNVSNTNHKCHGLNN